MGGCHGDRRPHVLGASFWSKDPIVLALSRLHCARLPGTGGFGFTPLSHSLTLRHKTQPTPTYMEVRQFGSTLNPIKQEIHKDGPSSKFYNQMGEGRGERGEG